MVLFCQFLVIWNLTPAKLLSGPTDCRAVVHGERCSAAICSPDMWHVPSRQKTCRLFSVAVDHNLYARWPVAQWNKLWLGMILRQWCLRGMILWSCCQLVWGCMQVVCTSCFSVTCRRLTCCQVWASLVLIASTCWWTWTWAVAQRIRHATKPVQSTTRNR